MKKGIEFMFDYDGDGDIDEFDEEMAEYELQLMEDEVFFEEEERGVKKKTGLKKVWGKSCSFMVLVAIEFFVLVLIISGFCLN